jgi:hypothetical protein
VHDLFEIETSPICEECYDSRWYLKMIGVSIVSLPCPIFYIDNSHDPVVLTLIVLIYSSLHPNIVVCVGTLSSTLYCSILSSGTYLSE